MIRNFFARLGFWDTVYTLDFDGEVKHRIIRKLGAKYGLCTFKLVLIQADGTFQTEGYCKLWWPDYIRPWSRFKKWMKTE